MAKKKYSLDDLQKMSADHRKNLYENAKKTNDGSYIVELIENNGLSLSTGGITMDNPLYLQIADIAWSKEGKTAAESATLQGTPALCAVDILLQNRIGNAYKNHGNVAVTAGAIVGEVMKHLGYRIAQRKPCPNGCIARSGATWKKI